MRSGRQYTVPGPDGIRKDLRIQNGRKQAAQIGDRGQRTLQSPLLLRCDLVSHLCLYGRRHQPTQRKEGCSQHKQPPGRRAGIDQKRDRIADKPEHDRRALLEAGDEGLEYEPLDQHAADTHGGEIGADLR